MTVGIVPVIWVIRSHLNDHNALRDKKIKAKKLTTAKPYDKGKKTWLMTKTPKFL